jgi:uncharacterized protein YdhG (YjbR/CyaY superfamily)
MAVTPVWTEEEKAAMQSSARERKSSRRDPAGERAEGERAWRESVAKMSDADRAMAERVDAAALAAVPDLARKTYYGMPAYDRDGVTICWFKNAGKFKTRYAMLEFSDKARLDEGSMWACSFAVVELTPTVESRIGELVRKAVG